MKPATDKEMMRLAVDNKLRETAEHIADLVMLHGLDGVHICERFTLGACAIRDKKRLHVGSLGVHEHISEFYYMRYAGARDRCFDLDCLPECSVIAPRSLKRHANILTAP